LGRYGIGRFRELGDLRNVRISGWVGGIERIEKEKLFELLGIRGLPR